MNKDTQIHIAKMNNSIFEIIAPIFNKEMAMWESLYTQIELGIRNSLVEIYE